MRDRQTTALNDSTGELLDSRLFKFATKLLLSLIIAVLALTLMQCTVKKPESPTWNTQIAVPLINRTYLMSEIIEKMDQDGIIMDDQSNIIFSISEAMDTVTLDADEFTTGDISYSAVQQLGLIDIPAPIVPPVNLDITMIGGLSLFLPGTVPATSFNIVSSLGPIGSFSSLGIIDAGAYVVVTNELGFQIAADSIELWDLGYNRSIGVKAFASPIPDGSTDSVIFDLSGQTISNDIEARIKASTLGGTVLSTSGKRMITVFRFDSDISAGAATAEIPALNLSFSETVSLGETDAIYRATLTTGTLQLTIANQTNLNADLDISFPDLTLSGVPLTVQRSIGPISNTPITVDLAGYDLTPTDSTVSQDIAVNISVSIPGTAPTHVSVSQGDQFMVDASLSNLSFGRVTGVFASAGSTIAPTQHNLEVPSGFDSVQLVTAMLTLNIENGVELPGDLNITLNGSNGKTLNLSGPVAPGTVGGAVVTQFVDTTVADFLSPMPSTVTISGNVSFGDGVTVGSISGGDYIYASLDILAPLEIIIPETSVEPTIESEEIDQDDIDVIIGNVIEARLLYNVINHMPLGARVNIYVGPDSATLISNPVVSFIDDIFVTAAPTVGSVASDTVSTGYQAVVIDSVDLHVLENDTLYIATEIILEDSNGQPVKLLASDYVTIIGRIEVEYLFDGDF